MLVNFEADVTIKSLTFKSEGGSMVHPLIASVQVELSNGKRSPVFEADNIRLYNEQKIVFD